jgi:hypothetical protein
MESSMLKTEFVANPFGSPAACTWQGKLVIAWNDTLKGGAICVAVGDAVTAGNYVSNIVQLSYFAPQAGTVAATEFAGRLYVAWMDAGNGSLVVANSNDGISFSAPVVITSRATNGPSLHGSADELYVSWIEKGSRQIALTSSRDGILFDSPVVLAHETAFPAAIASFKHPYFGQRIVVAWADWAGTPFLGQLPVVVAMASPKSFRSLDGSPLQTFFLGQPSICVQPSNSGAQVGPTICCGSGIFSVDIDGSRTTSLIVDVLETSTVVAVAGNLLLVRANSAPLLAPGNIVVGNWFDFVDIPRDLKDQVGKFCDPRDCTADPRLVCVLTKETQLVEQEPTISNGRRGDLVLSPADGAGVIGTILKNLDPHEFFDHMGILIDDGNTIRHCTESKDRLYADKSYFTGSLFGDPAPIEGLRPDLVKYGWPGPISQSIRDGFFEGWNRGRNPRWTYKGPGQNPPTFAQLNAFYDNEHPSTPVQISNLTYTPTYRDDHQGPVWPLLVRPSRIVDASKPWVRWTIGQIAARAEFMEGHYRFFAFTRAQIAEDATTFAPPVGDVAWAGLPQGANWAAGTPGLVCSTFVWFAARQAVAGLVPQIRLDRDASLPTSEAGRAQTDNFVDGLYAYHVPERSKSVSALSEWIGDKVKTVVKQRADDKITGLARVGIAAAAAAVAGAPWLGLTLSPSDAGQLVEGLTNMPTRVASGICNEFASDRPDRTTDSDWMQPGSGKSVSPDDILNFWDAPDEGTDERWGLWGSSERMMLVNARPELVLKGQIALSPGVARVKGTVSYSGRMLVGAKVMIGCRTVYTDLRSGFLIDVPASPIKAPPGNPEVLRDQLIRVEAYWDSPPGMLRTQWERPLNVGDNTLGDIQLQAPPEWRRRVEMHGELVMTHQVMFGHDIIGHSPWSASIFLQIDPDMAQDHRAEYDAGRKQTFSTSTDRCGGERAKFTGVVSMFDPTAKGPDEQPIAPPPEGALSIIIDWRYGMWDGSDDDENEIDHQSGTIVIGPGQSKDLPIALRDGDVPPDRASAFITIENNVNPA